MSYYYTKTELEEYGISSVLFYRWLRRLVKAGYVRRSQPGNPRSAWLISEEGKAVLESRVGAQGRPFYTYSDEHLELARATWNEHHSYNSVATALGIHAQTAKDLVKRNFVNIYGKPRG